MKKENIKIMKDYIQEQISEEGLNKNNSIIIDFAGLCEENETIQASKELGFKTRKVQGQGCWKLYK